MYKKSARECRFFIMSHIYLIKKGIYVTFAKSIALYKSKYIISFGCCQNGGDYFLVKTSRANRHGSTFCIYKIAQ